MAAVQYVFTPLEVTEAKDANSTVLKGTEVKEPCIHPGGDSYCLLERKQFPRMHRVDNSSGKHKPFPWTGHDVMLHIVIGGSNCE